jgi:hypothetical protein
MTAHVVLPWIHTVFANLKTWAKGVVHGLREPHRQTYLDQFTYLTSSPILTSSPSASTADAPRTPRSDPS